MISGVVSISEKYFEEMIGDAIDALPERFMEHAKNVAITWDNEPSLEQREKLRLRGDQTLFGLYEGIPLIKRGIGYNLVLPDKITIFRLPILHFAHTEKQVKSQVKHTLWHELAHHYGLDHDRIHELENQ